MALIQSIGNFGSELNGNDNEIREFINAHFVNFKLILMKNVIYLELWRLIDSCIKYRSGTVDRELSFE